VGKWKIGILIILVAVCLLGIHYFPRSHEVHTSGYKFHLGSEDSELVNMEPVDVILKGAIYHSIHNETYFEGYLVINDQVLDGVRISPDEMGRDKLYYLSDNTRYDIYGDIYVNKDFTEVVITPYEYESDVSETLKWNSVTGSILVAPADNRETAVSEAKKLTRDFREKAGVHWSFNE